MPYPFPINVNIPAAGNFPGDDQSIMQANYSNISGFLAIDHVMAGAAGAGFHQKVTFNSNNVPSTPTSPPVLFTNTVSPQTIPQLYFYSGTMAQSANQYSLVTAAGASYGSTFLFGGLIMKCGYTNSLLSGGTFTYSTNSLANFPNNTLSVVLTPTSLIAGTSGNAFFVSGTPTASGFIVAHSSATSKVFYYVAIGY